MNPPISATAVADTDCDLEEILAAYRYEVVRSRLLHSPFVTNKDCALTPIARENETGALDARTFKEVIGCLDENARVYKHYESSGGFPIDDIEALFPADGLLIKREHFRTRVAAVLAQQFSERSSCFKRNDGNVLPYRNEANRTVASAKDSVVDCAGPFFFSHEWQLLNLSREAASDSYAPRKNLFTMLPHIVQKLVRPYRGRTQIHHFCSGTGIPELEFTEQLFLQKKRRRKKILTTFCDLGENCWFPEIVVFGTRQMPCIVSNGDASSIAEHITLECPSQSYRKIIPNRDYRAPKNVLRLTRDLCEEYYAMMHEFVYQTGLNLGLHEPVLELDLRIMAHNTDYEEETLSLGSRKKDRRYIILTLFNTLPNILADDQAEFLQGLQTKMLGKREALFLVDAPLKNSDVDPCAPYLTEESRRVEEYVAREILLFPQGRWQRYVEVEPDKYGNEIVKAGVQTIEQTYLFNDIFKFFFGPKYEAVPESTKLQTLSSMRFSREYLIELARKTQMNVIFPEDLGLSNIDHAFLYKKT